MGELKNCPVCGKVFVMITRNLCPECMDKEELEFKKVRDFLRANPGLSIQEVSEETGVAEEKILRWIREGRVETTVLGGTGLTCRKCGEPIRTGDLCDKCARSLVSQFHAISRKTSGDRRRPERSSKGMIIADRLRDN